MEDTAMKKTYINPNIEVIKMKMTQHLLDGSINASISGTQSNESALGHEFDFDFDED